MGGMTRAVDHRGRAYGKIRAVRPMGKDSKGQIIWECSCECGRSIRVAGTLLTRGDYQSCGCGRVKHKLTNHPLYRTWYLIQQRVNNPKCPSYRYYGGRGITRDPRWSDFAVFLKDVGERPDNPPGHTSQKPYWSLDRIDPDGDYQPGNVRWATPVQQARNRSKVKV